MAVYKKQAFLQDLALQIRQFKRAALGAALSDSNVELSLLLSTNGFSAPDEPFKSNCHVSDRIIENTSDWKGLTLFRTPIAPPLPRHARAAHSAHSYERSLSKYIAWIISISCELNNIPSHCIRWVTIFRTAILGSLHWKVSSCCRLTPVETLISTPLKIMQRTAVDLRHPFGR